MPRDPTSSHESAKKLNERVGKTRRQQSYANTHINSIEHLFGSYAAEKLIKLVLKMLGRRAREWEDKPVPVRPLLLSRINERHRVKKKKAPALCHQQKHQPNIANGSMANVSTKALERSDSMLRDVLAHMRAQEASSPMTPRIAKDSPSIICFIVGGREANMAT